MNRLLPSLLALTVITCPALAGDITGSAVVKPPANGAAPAADKPVVVWIEGDVKFEVPKETPQLSQKDAQFTPSFMVVVAGQTVEMPNNDNIAHNVFSFSPAKKFNLGIYPKGESKTVQFDQAGVVELFCSIHRQMNAKIVVVPNPHFAQVKPNETFTIKGVPAGTYTIKAWHEGHVSDVQQVTVPETGEVKAGVTLTPEEPKQS